MKISKKILLLGATFSLVFVVLNNNENANADSNNAVPEKTEAEVIEEMHDGAKVAKQPTKTMWQNAIDLGKGEQQLLSSSSNNQQLQKWIIRTIMDKEVVGEKVSADEAIKIAEERLEYENTWLEIAIKDYKIVYTDEEVDAWITNGPDKQPLPTMYEQAEALNLTLEELNHVYDRDFYVKWVVWEKLYPILAEKYDVDLNAEIQFGESAPNTVLVNYYDLEIKQSLLK